MMRPRSATTWLPSDTADVARYLAQASSEASYESKPPAVRIQTSSPTIALGAYGATGTGAVAVLRQVPRAGSKAAPSRASLGGTAAHEAPAGHGAPVSPPRKSASRPV